METFKCWMIANFEILCAVAAGVISILLLLCFYNEEQHSDGGAGLVLIFFSCVQGNGRYFSIIKFIIIFIFIVVLPFTPEPHVVADIAIPVMLIVWMWISLVAGIIIGTKLAIYTRQNIDEIVSRRMLYRNSRVSLFSITWLYTLDRFSGIASSVTIGSIAIMASILI